MQLWFHWSLSGPFAQFMHSSVGWDFSPHVDSRDVNTNHVSNGWQRHFKKIFKAYSPSHPCTFWTSSIIWTNSKFPVENTDKKRTQEYSIVSLCHIKVKVVIFLLFTSYFLRNINSQDCTLQNNWPVWVDRSDQSRRVVTRCNEPDLLSGNKDYRGLARTKKKQQLPHLCGCFLK